MIYIEQALATDKDLLNVYACIMKDPGIQQVPRVLGEALTLRFYVPLRSLPGAGGTDVQPLARSNIAKRF